MLLRVFGVSSTGHTVIATTYISGGFHTFKRSSHCHKSKRVHAEIEHLTNIVSVFDRSGTVWCNSKRNRPTVLINVRVGSEFLKRRLNIPCGLQSKSESVEFDAFPRTRYVLRVNSPVFGFERMPADENGQIKKNYQRSTTIRFIFTFSISLKIDFYIKVRFHTSVVTSLLVCFKIVGVDRNHIILTNTITILQQRLRRFEPSGKLITFVTYLKTSSTFTGFSSIVLFTK